MRFLASLGMTTSLLINEARLAGSFKFECSVKPRHIIILPCHSERNEVERGISITSSHL